MAPSSSSKGRDIPATPPRDYAWRSPTPSVCPPPAKLIRVDETSDDDAPVDLVMIGELPSTAAFPDTDAGTKSTSSAPGKITNAGKVVSGMRRGFRDCYNQNLKRSPLAEGTVRLRLSVGCAGTVDAISASATVIDAEAVACMFDVIRLARFDPPSGGSVVVKVPVTFIRR